ncbi:hypothetical protein CI105_06360 [Candidatus Izimaplasma bacterium ZiA1]|uniref:PAQR family membrane homeostasis protein TrhA n=1 Tax=Candidatus Izimoplasma sp. ZiA1 TaxID=2024899 RepID=UPI000BAA60A8|nr:hypothetical protein CI105_06360 [Candidatus Izimaplasma bacterium ZiA1]
MKKTTSLGELIANAISHGIGVLLSITALILLLVKANTTLEVISGLIFGISLIVLYLSSTLFHSFPEKLKTVYTVFQRFDHSSIFILIAGTYTPFLLLLVNNTQGYIMLALLWSFTLIGIIMKSIWISKFQLIHLAIYLIMGWSVLAVFNEVYNGLNQYFYFLLFGGISYTIGVAFYLARFKYSHFVWHIFVLGGSVFHFLCIYLSLY